MKIRDFTKILGTIVIVAIVSTIVWDKRIPKTVTALSRVFENSLLGMAGMPPRPL